MTKIAFFNIRPGEKESLQEKMGEIEADFFETPINSKNLPEKKDYEIISILGLSKIDEDVLKALPNLKLITTRSTGFDQIDLEASEKSGVLVSNVPTYGEETVAEYTIALLLALSRKIPQAINKVKQEKTFHSQGLTGFDLIGKTLGVIGTGHIGTHVIKIAKGFDAYPNQNLAQDLGFEYTSLENLLNNSDVITLHVPLLPSTNHLINLDNINLIKKGTVIVNTSRGEVLQTEALIKALEEGILSGAALDVIENEKALRVSKKQEFFPQLNKLLEMDNVLISPHNAYNTEEAKEKIQQTTIDNIKSFLNGNPINLVKPK